MVVVIASITTMNTGIYNKMKSGTAWYDSVHTIVGLSKDKQSEQLLSLEVKNFIL